MRRLFFKQSGVVSTKLKQIWALADTHNTRFLDKEAFCIAFQLIELVRRAPDVSLKLAASPVQPVGNDPFAINNVHIMSPPGLSGQVGLEGRANVALPAGDPLTAVTSSTETLSPSTTVSIPTPELGRTPAYLVYLVSQSYDPGGMAGCIPLCAGETVT